MQSALAREFREVVRDTYGDGFWDVRRLLRKYAKVYWSLGSVQCCMGKRVEFGEQGTKSDVRPASFEWAVCLLVDVAMVLDTLPPYLRALVRAVYVDGLSHEQAAQRCGIGKATVSRWLKLALGLLGEEVERRGLKGAYSA